MEEKIPVLTVGRYAGIRMDKVPNSYLRWMLTQNFPKDLMDFAKKKVEASDYNSLSISVSRHALDMFSKRFLKLWISHVDEYGEKADGISTFVAKMAQEAWDHGEDVSRHRHEHDGIVKAYNGIKWVFGVGAVMPEYKEVVTVM